MTMVALIISKKKLEKFQDSCKATLECDEEKTQA